MRTTTPITIQRKNYTPPVFQIERTALHFVLSPTATVVRSFLTLKRVSDGPLVLDGVDLQLVSVHLNGVQLAESGYELSDDLLTLHDVPAQATLAIVTELNPDANTALEGLYRSSGNYCTQCEAEGFRKITYYLDRPDVLSVFDVTITATTDDCPVLLSNGNLVSSENLEGGKHRVHWHDPHPKPCYLFALVAGELAVVEDTFTTQSGLQVDLQIYVQAHNIANCDFAMQSLKASMRWDEMVYGFEYDLERFMIVAVDDFNMGAMENKGLNVFNSKFVLASSETATDSDFKGVEAVIAHEYFHNWTGNRITCRDWFQLSLKEGLTVFRDQSFSSDQHSSTVKRIEDVRLLRARQFAEDAGPLAHPIRPDSYIEINNFYTLTVYEKGAEVIRMLHTLVGVDAWRKGIDLYVQRHDGSAATCDEFIDAMQDGSGVDLTQFRLWYSIAGTPELQISDHFDKDRYTLTVRQHTPDTPGQRNKPALHIPLKISLLNKQGESLRLSLGRPDGDSVVLDVVEHEQQFVFEGLAERPIPSLLQNFSAPVKLLQEVDDSTLIFLMVHDADAFNRWEAGQRLATRMIDQQLQNSETGIEPVLADALGSLLTDKSLDPAFLAEMLSLPSIDTLAETQKPIDINALQRARKSVLVSLASRLRMPLESLVCQDRQAEELSSGRAMAMRSLANAALNLLHELDPTVWVGFATEQYQRANNMTDRLAALKVLCDIAGAEREDCLGDFLQRFSGERLVIDKWFAVQAASSRDAIVDDVLALCEHPAFELENPNRMRSLIGTFAMANPTGFHATDGRGYVLLADYVMKLDKLNPQIAARLVSPLGGWQRFTTSAAGPMRVQLERILNEDKLSPDVFELVSKSLETGGA
ncbi:MAG: aminopeptidase N [Granulosicoccus sp.]